MKFLLLAFLFFFPSLARSQDITIPIDSLAKHGYHVRIYKPKSHTRTIVFIHRDTIYLSRPEIIYIPNVVVLHDTLLHEVVTFHTTETLITTPVPVITDSQIIHLAWIGDANTNGYSFSIGTMIGVGKHLSFFIGGGAGYNSVTKTTHLDISGLIIISP